MITGKWSYRRPKMTMEQKALKKIIRPVAKEARDKLKAAAPKKTGSLKQSFGIKIISKKGTAAAVVGVRTWYQKKTKRFSKIPNFYAAKAEVKHRFLAAVSPQEMLRKMMALAKIEVEKMLEKGSVK